MKDVLKFNKLKVIHSKKFIYKKSMFDMKYDTLRIIVMALFKTQVYS